MSDNASGVLASGISDTATSLELESGQGGRFPAISVYDDYFFLTLVDVLKRYEIVKVTARVGDTFTIERAQGSTAALAFSKGVPVELRVTAGSITGLMDVWWIREDAAVSYVGADTLVVAGDKTARYHTYRAIRLWQTANDDGYIVSSTYSVDDDATTVVVENAVVDAGLAAVEVGGAVSASPKYYGRAASADVADTAAHAVTADSATSADTAAHAVTADSATGVDIGTISIEAV
jgi:hypothetical protein